MWGDMSLWNVEGPLLHSGDQIVPIIMTVDYTFNLRLIVGLIFDDGTNIRTNNRKMI